MRINLAIDSDRLLNADKEDDADDGKEEDEKQYEDEDEDGVDGRKDSGSEDIDDATLSRELPVSSFSNLCVRLSFRVSSSVLLLRKLGADMTTLQAFVQTRAIVFIHFSIDVQKICAHSSRLC